MLICLDQRTGTGCGAENRDGAQHCAQCGRNLRFAMELQNVGALVGSYRIARLIGHGGFGAVYEAQDTRTGQRVALKESFDADSIRNFQREFAVLKNLQHPNLPRYFEVFEAQGNGYLAMEFVPGQNLEEVLRANGGQPLFESQVIGYAIQVCDALAYLHTQTPPLFHRDIKPANIRITPAGLIKLVDFGLVKQGTGTTQSSQRAVTPAYAPLEQFGRIAGAHTDARSDIYALGATLYHLLTAREPVASIERVAVHPDPLLMPQTLNPRLSNTLANALVTAMGMRQMDRFADMRAMQDALVGTKPVASGSALPKGKPPPGPARAVQSRSNFPWAWVFGVGAITLMAAFFIFPAMTPRPAQPTAVPPTARKETVVAVETAESPTIPPSTVPQSTKQPPTAEPTVPTITRAPSSTTLATAVPQAGTVQRRGNDNAEMVFVPGGKFLMGSKEQEVEEAYKDLERVCEYCDNDIFEDEKPQQLVLLKSYWIDRYEVTNRQWNQCVDAGACKSPVASKSRTHELYYGNSQYDNYPVINVSWNDARDYCAMMGKRLPTEAEWEKAARGTDGRIYPWGGNFEQNRVNNNWVVGDTMPVDSYPRGASPYGALNMAGNVSEWVNDWYDSDTYNSLSRENPKGPSSGVERVLRGGAFGDGSATVRAAGRRSRSDPRYSRDFIGFRCAQ